jgi:hypothetical protein
MSEIESGFKRGDTRIKPSPIVQAIIKLRHTTAATSRGFSAPVACAESPLVERRKNPNPQNKNEKISEPTATPPIKCAPGNCPTTAVFTTPIKGSVMFDSMMGMAILRIVA